MSRLMRDKERNEEIFGNDMSYVFRREMVERHLGIEDGPIAKVRGAYDDWFTPYAWPGGYPILFLNDRLDILCAKCAREEFIMRNVDITCDIYYEGPPYQCEECNAEIESAYGDPDEEESDD